MAEQHQCWGDMPADEFVAFLGEALRESLEKALQQARQESGLEQAETDLLEAVREARGLIRATQGGG